MWDYSDKVKNSNSELKSPAHEKITTAQKIKLVEEILEEVRPRLMKDGGNCELIEIDGDKVMVKMTGACMHCQLASITISGIQERLTKKAGFPLRIIPVRPGAAH